MTAINARGDAAVAWLRPRTRNDPTEDVVVARRARGGTWTTGTVGGAPGVVEPQVVVTARGDTIAAWREFRERGADRGPRVVAAVARRGDRFGRGQAIATQAVSPRIAALADGRTLMVWRDARSRSPRQLRYALREPGGRFGRSRGLGVDGLAAAVTATSDGGAVIAWGTPRKRSRALRAARLRAGRQRPDRSVVVSPSLLVGRAGVRPGVRLAGGPDGVVVASWVSSERPARLLTRRLLPLPGPVNALPARSLTQSAPAAVALGPNDSAIATFLDSPVSAAETDLFAASGTSAGGYAEPMSLTPAFVDPDTGGARPTILPSGEALAVWSQVRNAPGPVTADIAVARRPPGATRFAPPEVLAPGESPVLAQAVGRVLVAWPAPRAVGGVVVAERSR